MRPTARSPLLVLSVAVLPACAGDGSTGVVTEPEMPAPEVTTLVVSPGQVTLTESDETDLSVTVRDQYGEAILAPGLTWTSLNSVVATVDADGRVVAVREGTAQIRASADGVADTADIQVLPYPAPGLLALGDSMMGYVPPGVADTIRLDVPEDRAVQFRTTTTHPNTTFWLHAPDGASRGEAGSNVSSTWYSAVYLGSIGSMRVYVPSWSTRGARYTLVADSIHMAPEWTDASFEVGDTVRGETIRNGDRDVYRVYGVSGAEELFVLLGPEWFGRSLHIVQRSLGYPVATTTVTRSDSTWVSAGVMDLPEAGVELEFRASQPWGPEWDGRYEFVVRSAGAPAPGGD